MERLGMFIFKIIIGFFIICITIFCIIGLIKLATLDHIEIVVMIIVAIFFCWLIGNAIIGGND